MNGRSKQLRADERRTQILTSASGAFRRLGVRRAGMREIAHAAGLSTGNLYYYFRNKQELIYFCQDRTLDALLDVAARARRTTGDRFRLRNLIEGHLRVTLGERALGPLHLELDELPAPLRAKVVQKRDRYERQVRALLSDAQKRGNVRPGDPKLDAFLLLGALNWAARWYHAGGVFEVADVAKHYADRLLNGLLVERDSRGS